MQKALYFLRIRKAAPVVRIGHPILRTPCEKVNPADILDPNSRCSDAVKAIKSVFASPYHNILGLAAPQVGFALRIIAYNVTDHKTIRNKSIAPTPLTFLINPTLEILERETKWAAEYESCESMPHYNAIVRRPGKVRVKALDLKGEELNFQADGFLARILHHEMDHLDGISLIDRTIEKTLRHDQYIDVYENFPSSQRAR